MNLLADYNLPFAAALVLMLALAVLQMVGLGDFELDADGDIDIDADAGEGLGAVDGLLSIIGLGRLPFMMWLALLLALFAGVGIGLQQLAQGLLGAPLDMWLGAAGAGVLALPLTGAVSRPIAAVMPKDETSAVSTDELVGRRAAIATGTARKGYAARAQVKDRFGQVHNVMVEPHDGSVELAEGEQVLLVRREGELFFAVEVQDRRLAPAD